MITSAIGLLRTLLPDRKLLIVTVLACFTGFMVSGAWAQGNGGKLMASGEKSLAAGDYDKAIDELSKAIKSGSLGKPEMAKAFVARGQALQGKGSQARAIADFTNALWLESLSGADTARALALRGTSRQSLGQTKAAADDFKKAEAAQPGISGQVGGSAVAASGATTTTRRRPANTEDEGFFSSLFGGSGDQPPPRRTVSRGAAVKVARATPHGENQVRRRSSRDTSSGGLFGGLFGGDDGEVSEPPPNLPQQLASAGANTRTRVTASAPGSSGNVNRPGVLTDILPSGSGETVPQRKPGTEPLAATGAPQPIRNVPAEQIDEPGFFERVFSGRTARPSSGTTSTGTTSTGTGAAGTGAATASGPRRLVARSDGLPASGSARPAPSGPRTQRDTSLPTFVNQPRLTDRILANDAVEPGGNAGIPTRIANLRAPGGGLRPNSRRVDTPAVNVAPAQLDWNQTTRVERGQVASPIAVARPQAVRPAAPRQATQVARAQARPAPAPRRPVVAGTRPPQAAPPASRRLQPPSTPGQARNQSTFGATVRSAGEVAGETVRSAVDWVGNAITGVGGSAAPAVQRRPQVQQQRVASAPVRQPARTTYRAPAKPTPRRETATAGGGYVLQLAARQRRSDAEAAARTVSSRHSGILAGAQPYIVKADIPGKGVYYRVRVGPYRTKAQVNSVCTQLKGKGQDCFATR
ncbi:hypothetical protein MNBD_ALPHA09-1351 [hydrothermal vent metagenome]|uniref:SPOR domain-containing protein n=1 Tax=hydrothermal vent metagenome TaxID=652676 RepID=A0A3B0TLI0_9ZZZZ